MLTFATEFPVDTASTAADFISVVKGWLLGSPHTKLTEADLQDFHPTGAFAAETADQRVTTLGMRGAADGHDYVAFRNAARDGDIDWETVVVFSKSPNRSWISVRTSRESIQPIAKLPAAKKPLAVIKLLEGLGGGWDGNICVSAEPHRLSNNDIDLAARVLNGHAGCRLPIVYVSSGFDGKYAVDAEALAHDLSGMAHVMVEPNRPFSRRLQLDVQSENVYGGTIGIYWPEGTGRKAFFPGRAYESHHELKWAIIEEVRAALLNRRPLPQCSWATVEAEVRRGEYESLKSSGSQELSSFIETFDAEQKARIAQLESAESEIARLQREVMRLQAAEVVTSGFALRRGKEQDFFPGEVMGTVTDAIAECASRLPAGSRKAHILESIAEANPTSSISKEKREALKKLLRDYRSMDSATRSGLEELGFTITEEGKHYKLVYHDDDRYVFPLAKSGSDRRGGLNSVSDIAKRIL